MSTIPTLIVAPAILAAGLAYRYGGSDRRSGRIQDSQEYFVRHGTRRGSNLEQQSAGDEAPRMQHMNELIPTTMIGPGLQRYPGAGDVNSLAAQTGETKYFPVAHPDDKHFDSYKPQGISSKLYRSTIIGPYPRNEDERHDSSVLSRAMHGVTGDLGPIEHQSDAALRYQDKLQQSVPQAEHLRGSPSVHPTLTKSSMYKSDAPVNQASRAAKDVTDQQRVSDKDANQAAIDVTRQGTRDEQLQKERELAAARESSGGWFWNTKKQAEDKAGEIADSAKDKANETRGWFWGKKEQAEDKAAQAADAVKGRAEETVDAVKNKADETRGWFWSTKQQAEDKASDAADTVRDKASDAANTAKQAADDTRGWFWNKKEQAEDKAGEAANAVKGKAEETADAVKNKADETRGWFWSTKQQAEDKASDAADTVRDKASDAANTAKQAADDTRGWFWNKKEQAEDKAGEAANAVKDRAGDMADSAKQAADDTQGWFGAQKERAQDIASQAADSMRGTAQDAEGWLRSKKDDAASAAESARLGARGAMQAAGQGASDAADSLREGASDAAQSLGHGASGAADSLRQVGSSAKQNTARDTRGGWLQDTKQTAENAAGEARSWLAGTTDDLGRSAEATADRSRAWLWQKTSDADQQLAHAAGSVERTADSASARAQERADAARTEIADSGRESADKLRDRSWYARRDSAVDYDEPQLKNQNSVMQALDNKFDEARAALRSTREDLKAMAPQPSNEGLVGVGEAQIGRAGGINGTSASDAANRAANGQPVELKFVESNSGIPVINSSN
ncbi:hypothetical protein H4S01_001592 [Coemansia sp. RSA 2610]|nr:hypothetical protein H4S01_001592 [Coemansia sp. RSA 2610]